MAVSPQPPNSQIFLDICGITNYSPHPRIRKNHHFLESLLKTVTNMRCSMTPSHSIQQKAARKK